MRRAPHGAPLTSGADFSMLISSSSTTADATDATHASGDVRTTTFADHTGVSSPSGTTTNGADGTCSDDLCPAAAGSDNNRAHAATAVASARGDTTEQPAAEAATSPATDSAASCDGAFATATAADSITATATLAALATDESHGGVAGAKHSRKVVVAEVACCLHAPLAALLLGPQLRGDTLAFCLQA